MKPRVQLAAVAVVLSVIAFPLRAQEAVATPATAARVDSMPAVRTAAIVVTAERVDDRERLLRLARGNRFLANELRAYDRRAAALEARLGELKEVAARREAEIRAIDAQREAARVERAKLEARLTSLEQSGSAATMTATRGDGGD